MIARNVPVQVLLYSETLSSLIHHQLLLKNFANFRFSSRVAIRGLSQVGELGSGKGKVCSLQAYESYLLVAPLTTLPSFRCDRFILLKLQKCSQLKQLLGWWCWRCNSRCGWRIWQKTSWT